MAHNHIGNSPRVETQYATLFYLINNFKTINGHSPNLTAEYLVRYIRTHPGLYIKEPHDKLVNAKIWGFIEEKEGMTYLTNKAHDYLLERDRNELTDLLDY